MLSRERLQAILDHFPKLSIALVGDLFLDRYLDIQPGVEELSIETGLEAYQVDCVRNYPGALGTVMNNLAGLGVGRLVPVTVIGNDGHGHDLLHELLRLPVDDSHIIRDPRRLTPTYTKPMKQDASGAWRELNRLDVRSRVPLRPEVDEELRERLRHAFGNCDGLIVLDQISERDWGVISDGTRALLKQLANDWPDKLIYIDSRARLAEFEFGTLKGNRAELLAAVGEVLDSTCDLTEIAADLCAKTRRTVFATLGEQGILVAQPDLQVVRVPSFPVTGPLDIVGAGDSATSGIVAALLSGATAIEAAEIGNLVASITIQQLGVTGRATPREVLAQHAKFA